MSTELPDFKDIFSDPDLEIPASAIDEMILERHPEFLHHQEDLRCMTRLKMLKIFWEMRGMPGNDLADISDQLIQPENRELVIAQIVDAMKQFFPN